MPAVALRIMQPSGQACYILDRCSTGKLCSTPHPPFAPSTAGSICAMILIRLSPTTRFKQRQVKNAFCVSGQAVETHSLEPTPDWTGETEHRLPIWILHHPERMGYECRWRYHIFQKPVHVTYSRSSCRYQGYKRDRKYGDIKPLIPGQG